MASAGEPWPRLRLTLKRRLGIFLGGVFKRLRSHASGSLCEGGGRGYGG